MNRVLRTAVLFFVVILAWLPVSRGHAESLTISLDRERYHPQFDAAAYGRYQGVQIFMSSFTSRAKNTGMNYYYGQRETVAYTGYPTLESYAWYCFEKALRAAGFKVYDYEAVRGMGEMKITILSWSAEEFVIAVALYRAGLIRLGYLEYRVVLPSLPVHADAKTLEENAYRMMDRAVTAMLDDPSFERMLRVVAE